jgi:hypothetical protein
MPVTGTDDQCQRRCGDHQVGTSMSDIDRQAVQVGLVFSTYK